EIAKYTLTELKNPARLAIDLHGIAGKFATTQGAGLVKSVRLAKRDADTRIVIDGQSDAMPKYEITRNPHGLDVRVGEQKIATATPVPEARGLRPEAQPTAKLIPVRAVDLRTLEGRTEVLVALEDAVRFEISRPDPSTCVLTLHGAALPQRLERSLDASALGGPVATLASYRVPGSAGDVKVVASVAKGTTDEMTAQKGTLVWKFSGKVPVAQATAPAPRAA